MAGQRQQHTAAFQAQIARAALKRDKTVNELPSRDGIHPTLSHGGKKQLLAGADHGFSNGSQAATAEAEAEKAERFEPIGRLKRELEGLQKKSARSPERLRPLVEPEHPEWSVRRPWALLGLSRSSLYYEPAVATEENLRRRRLDPEDTALPFLGSRRLTKWLIERGEAVNRKRVRRLRLLGLEAIYRKPKRRAAGRGHRLYP